VVAQWYSQDIAGFPSSWVAPTENQSH